MPDSFHIDLSLNKAVWSMPDIGFDRIEKLARAHDIPEVIARLLAGRNVEDVKSFLFPTLKDNFPDPFLLQGMKEAAEYLAQAIQQKRKIAIFGDFDVDGATSSALLHRFLKHYGVNAPIYIPDRLTEGYGPNVEALKTLKDNGAEIVVLLDCGTTAFEIIEAGNSIGLEIVIIDHHEAEEQLPAAKHVINPKRKDDVSGYTMLAACGVTFMVCVAVNNILRQSGSSPSLKDWLDLVALGTVCDMVPLTGPNRLFVRAGFQQMNKRNNPGIKALLDVAKVNSEPNTYTAGFILGPRINAGGRIHKSDLGAKLLSTDDPDEANSIAWLLEDCNAKRKDIQQAMEEHAMRKAEELGLDQHPAIIVDDPAWHPGLAGLVAGRLKDKYGKPACVVTYTENAGVREGKGSGRSIPGIHIAQAFIDARHAGLLEKGGGHAMAGGFTIAPDKLPEFRTFIYDHIARQAKGLTPSILTVIEGMLTVRGIRADLVRLIQDNIGPFGQDHPEPLFLLKNVRLHSVDVMGASHIRAQISDWEGGPRIKGVAFKTVGTPMGDALLKQGRQPFHLVGYLKLDTWNGREQAEFHIKDAAFAMAQESAEAV